MIAIKRVYEDRTPDEGYGILVDRIWPRGVHKGRIDVWLKDAGPSNELRTWFGHEPPKFEEFARRYRDELDANAAVATLRDLLGTHGDITLLYGAKDTEHNQAVVLKSYLED
ncbi:DUF488 domain-containing protein [Occultella aeris]|uniref:DUF488 domain-containing protein n=1 Tax=Occultella aeris TaxID=2761496 RepID=A0A7M4DIG4_9MICO|nr:DUF488 domain-containing protein [Occultella aeris]VZO36737.1 hypothetical protein HALOF300_01916 [Occultella aeris]